MPAKTWAIGLAAIYVAAALDAACGALPGGARQPFTLLVGIGATLLARGGYRFVWPAIAGCVDDLVEPGLLGAGTLVGLVVGWMLTRSGVRLAPSRWQASLATLIAAWIWSAATAMLDRLAGISFASMSAIATEATGAALTSAVLMALTAMVCRAIAERSAGNAPLAFP